MNHYSHLSRWLGIVVLCGCLHGLAAAAEFRAGAARINITPPTPFWLTGYAARTNPAATVRSPLWAKALALQDPRGGRAIIVTTDLIGLPADVSTAAATRLAHRHGLTRSQIVFNSSHTHSGPVVGLNLSVMFSFDAQESERVRTYADKLAEDLATVAGQALASLAPAHVTFANGRCTFAMNRREATPSGVRLGLNPLGPMDHSVPTLIVRGADRKLRAVLFGYACHNTTLGGDTYEIDGDYAGMAQREIEAAHPGATALFLMLCGGDQNPQPRGRYEDVESHGRELAAAVTEALKGKTKALRPPIRTAWQTTRLDFVPHTRETYVAESQIKNVFRQRRAKLMLEAYDRGQPPRQLDYPVQAIRLGEGFTLLALGGEVVMDYNHRAKREFPRENLVVSGYCNDVAGYIPSLRVLREGGYEPVDSTIYYGLPGPFAENVEEAIFQAIRTVMHEVGAK